METPVYGTTIEFPGRKYYVLEVWTSWFFTAQRDVQVWEGEGEPPEVPVKATNSNKS
jgi:hypothetical protein